VTRERDVALRRVVDTLGGDDRAVVVLAARGYPPGEIAGMLGLSSAATRTRLCRARGRLRERLVLDGFGA
jgi:DNA-directed RNA polymerase specialized sigma24 family protein